MYAAAVVEKVCGTHFRGYGGTAAPPRRSQEKLGANMLPNPARREACDALLSSCGGLFLYGTSNGYLFAYLALWRSSRSEPCNDPGQKKHTELFVAGALFSYGEPFFVVRSFRFFRQFRETLRVWWISVSYGEHVFCIRGLRRGAYSVFFVRESGAIAKNGVRPLSCGTRTIPKVLRDYNVRESLPGAALSIAEKSHCSAAISGFFAQPNDELVAKMRKKPLAPPPRLAALDFARAVDNQLRNGVGRRLAEFQYIEGPFMARLRSEDPVSYGELALLCPMLVVNMDQGPPQFAATSFLIWEIQLNWVCLWDPAAHRCWNDVKLALRRSKLMSIIYETTILFNYRNGHWDRSAWFKTIIEVVRGLHQTLSSEDPLLRWCWKQIACEHNWREASELDSSAGQSFIDGLPDIREYQAEGEAVALGRWFSWMHKDVLGCPNHLDRLSRISIGKPIPP